MSSGQRCGDALLLGVKSG